jgi:hypothetical protein
MTVVTGTADYQALFQGLASEIAIISGQPYGLPLVKLSGDSVASVTQLNTLIPTAYDYISLSYTGSNLTGAVFRQGGAGGAVIATLVITYDGSNNILTVTRT